VERGAGARVDRALVVLAAQRERGGGAAHVRPGEDRRERSAVSVQREQAVPEDGDAHRGDVARAAARAGQAAIERARDRLHQRAGMKLDAAVGGRSGLVGHVAFRARLRAARRVEDTGAGGAGADVERHHEHVR
jgi:hypothetical protein